VRVHSAEDRSRPLERSSFIMVKRTRAKPRASTRARKTARPAARRAPQAAKGAARPPARRWPTGQVSLKVVAKRADADPTFFKTVAANPNDVNGALAPFKMRLSEVDAGRLGDALAKMEALRVELQDYLPAARGWGAWPVGPHKLPPGTPVKTQSPDVRTPDKLKGGPGEV
jgi:hypothetical protein